SGVDASGHINKDVGTGIGSSNKSISGPVSIQKEDFRLCFGLTDFVLKFAGPGLDLGNEFGAFFLLLVYISNSGDTAFEAFKTIFPGLFKNTNLHSGALQLLLSGLFQVLFGGQYK